MLNYISSKPFFCFEWGGIREDFLLLATLPRQAQNLGGRFLLRSLPGHGRLGPNLWDGELLEFRKGTVTFPTGANFSLLEGAQRIGILQPIRPQVPGKNLPTLQKIRGDGGRLPLRVYNFFSLLTVCQ